MPLRVRMIVLWAIFFINLIVIGLFWYDGSQNLFATKAGTLVALGRIMGLLLEYFILVQLILIGRVRVVERLYGFDKLNQLHRTNGLLIGGTMILHPLFLIFGYAALNETDVISQFFDFIKNWHDVFNALIGLTIILIVVGTSIAIVRRKLKYERWHFIHLFIYVGIYFAFDHQTNTADVSRGTALYYWLTLNFIVFGLLILYRFLRPLYFFSKHQFYVDRITRESPTVNSVYIKGKNIGQFVFEPGQFGLLTFLKRGLWPTHPFSFSAAPNGEWLRFSIKDSGDFTSQIESIPLGTKVIIEGPLGAFSERMAQRNKFLFIAGGIGITPLRSLSEAVSKKGKDAILMYTARSEDEFVFKKELDSYSLKKEYIISIPGKAEGRIDLAKIQSVAPDFMEREIFICGPRPMILSLRDQLLAAGVGKEFIRYELFSF